MLFKDKLKQYIDLLSCNIKDLSAASGIPHSTLSFYTSGRRSPRVGSEQFDKLVRGIYILAKERSIPHMTRETISRDIGSCIAKETHKLDADRYSARFSYLLESLGINQADMAQTIHYDASFLSFVKQGKRVPSDIALFTRKVASYILSHYEPEHILRVVREFPDTAVPDEDLQNPMKVIEDFLWTYSPDMPDPVSKFLQTMDTFDLNEFVRTMRFDPAAASTPPQPAPKGGEYRGVNGQKEAELDFLKTAVANCKDSSVFLFTEMDISDMAPDKEFSKQWMTSLALLIGQKNRLSIVHNLNRPFEELMFGLAAWIPLYMTGMVDSYYVKSAQPSLYQHLLYVSDACALSGECIRGFHADARYLFSEEKAALAYAQKCAGNILKKATPLMEIHTSENSAQFKSAYEMEATPGDKRYISSSLPVCLLPFDLLTSIFEQNQIPQAKSDGLLKKIQTHRASMPAILSKGKLSQEMPLVSEAEFSQHPLTLDLTAYGHYTPLSYSYEAYLAHVEALKRYAEKNANYSCEFREDFPFRNIEIRILAGKWVWITKSKTPATHFIIRHPVLCNAIENLRMPLYQ